MFEKFNLSIPFLASNENQIAVGAGNKCIECTIFNREDLENESWELIWKNVNAAINFVGTDNITFHFPVNNSNYVDDPFVKKRLIETLKRSSDNGIHGVVVHSNRIRPLNQWSEINLEIERIKVIDTLNEIYLQNKSGTTWLALENMPVMDNFCQEIDPLFCYPKDFKNLIGGAVGVVWDLCHFTNTLATIDQVLSGRQNKKYYPNIQKCSLESFLEIKDQIYHWHFSAFKGIPNPDTKDYCKEGVLPCDSTLGENVYAHLLHLIYKNYRSNQHIVLEISEINYENRTKVYEMIKWIDSKGYL